ncbi:uncharacterized protein [Hoplias malabaricus]|uniref:uncharacterized protein n=1 Tax=Hoplias malabaricus TaxID=27720 RepID=UPI003461E20D
MVESQMLFNSSSLVPSESVVLDAIRILLDSRRANLSDSIQVLNYSYHQISNTSYLLILTLNMSVNDTDISNKTYMQVENSTNQALNTLLNEPGAEQFEPKSYNFTTSANQIEGAMEYSFQYGDTITPLSFLDEIMTLSGPSATVSPTTPTSHLVTLTAPQTQIYTSAMVESQMLFNSSSLVPSESVVLDAIRILLDSRRANLSDSIQVLNYSYHQISNTSYLLILTLNMSVNGTDISNKTYMQVENSTNQALNTLLNEPGAEQFEPKSYNFTTSANQIEGAMEYSFQYGDTITPLSFLDEIRTLSGPSATVSPTTPTSHLVTLTAPQTQIYTSAMVESQMLFNSSSPVSSESVVLNAIRILLDSRRANLSNSIQVLNYSYHQISNTSYLLILTLNKSVNDTDISNKTYMQVENSTNQALNTLLNEPGAEQFEPKSYNFTTSANQIEGAMEYSFQYGDTITPLSFLDEIRTLSGPSATVSPTTPTSHLVTLTAPQTQIYTSAMVESQMLFNSSSPVSSESVVLNAIRILLDSRRANLSNSIQVLNYSYHRISNTSYLLILTLNMSVNDTDISNKTYMQVENSTNQALNTLLNEPGAEQFEPKSYNFTTSANQIEGAMEYNFQYGDTITPLSFLDEIRTLSGPSTTVSPTTPTSLLVTLTTPQTQIYTSAMVESQMLFNSSSPVPSESVVLNAIRILLDSRRANLSDSIQVLNYSYHQISNTSYLLILTLNMSVNGTDISNKTYMQVENSTNQALNTLLNEPGADQYEPKSYNFTTSANQIEGAMEYIFQDGDTITPLCFLNELRNLSVTNSTSFFLSFGFRIDDVIISKNLQLRNDTYSAVQDKINSLICLTGCCGAVRRRYRRRRSYNVEYRIHHSLL